MLDITVIIVVKDNPPTLRQSLDSVISFSKKILIADIGMTTEAVQLVKQYPSLEIVSIKKEVPYVEIIRDELRKLVKTEYVFFLDPDEIVPQELISYLGLHKDHVAYSIPRKNIIFSRWIQHSRWWPDYQTRLFKKNSVSWPTTIHSQPVISGKKHTIPLEEKYAIIHHNYENITHFLEKELRYAQGEAQERFITKSPYSVQAMLHDSLGEFIGRFFSFEGYRDGMHGFSLSLLQMIYPILVYIYYWEKNNYREQDIRRVAFDMRSFFRNGLRETNVWLNQKKFSNGPQKVLLKLQNLFLK